MHQKYENIFSQAQIDFLNHLFQKYLETEIATVKDAGSATDRSIRIYFNRKNCAEWPDIENMVKKICPDISAPAVVFFCERQYEPTSLHIDPDHLYRTCVIPLKSDSFCQTLLWQQRWDSIDDFHNFIMDFDTSMQTMINDISGQHPIGHTYDSNKEAYIADYLPIEEVFYYKTGDAFFFDSKQLHCSSDWRQCNGMEYKDFAGFHLQYL